MVQVMIYRSVDPFADPILAKTFWIDFITGMPVNIVNNRKQKEDRQVQAVNRDCKQKHSSDPNFYYGFKGVKCIGSPWRWICRLMMYQVKEFKNFWMMHQPVCPVKIGVVNNKH